jgi:outer membrane protein OmpA-like peptidoglycan-associated protein
MKCFSVRTILEEFGIPAEKIRIQNFGESYPFTNNLSTIAKAYNRRVDIIIEN